VRCSLDFSSLQNLCTCRPKARHECAEQRMTMVKPHGMRARVGFAASVLLIMKAGIGKWYSTTRPQGMTVPGVGCDWIVSEQAAFKESCRSVKRFVNLQRTIQFICGRASQTR